jgi:hypothetical protein
VNRFLLAGLALAAGVGVVVLVLVLRNPSDPKPGVEQRLRNTLTRPGPDQIAPGGERPSSISCREHGDRRWICAVSYPSGRRLRCLVGERPLDQGPICE